MYEAVPGLALTRAPNNPRIMSILTVLSKVIDAFPASSDYVADTLDDVHALLRSGIPDEHLEQLLSDAVFDLADWLVQP